ncbi:MAG: PEPxxWA-CTERM sorting domain-containing protein [Pseudomonadota bacterium]
MRTTLMCAASFAAMFLAGSANATVLVFDDFEGYGAQANFTGFSNLNVTDGAVDVLQDAGILSTPYGSGFVDLDGTAAQGGFLRSDFYSFQAGDRVTFSFDYAGNRQGTFDTLNYGFKATALFTFKDAVIQNGAVTNTTSNLISNSFGGSVANLGPTAPWTRLTFSFTAGSAGSLQAFVGTRSQDAKGPLIDNFSLSVDGPGGVPEPSSWALMILGFGGAGAMLRRRTQAYAA